MHPTQHQVDRRQWLALALGTLVLMVLVDGLAARRLREWLALPVAIAALVAVTADATAAVDSRSTRVMIVLAVLRSVRLTSSPMYTDRLSFSSVSATASPHFDTRARAAVPSATLSRGYSAPGAIAWIGREFVIDSPVS